MLRVGGEPTRNKREKRPPTATTTMSGLLSAAHTCYPTLLTINCSSTLILLYSSAAACCCLLPLDVVFDRPSRHRRRRPLARAGKGRKKEKKAQACQANPFPVPPGMHIQNFILCIDAHLAKNMHEFFKVQNSSKIDHDIARREIQNYVENMSVDYVLYTHAI